MGKSAITFPATVYKVQTLVDGGIRVTLDLPENAIADAAALMECKRRQIPLVVTVKQSENQKNGKKREQRQESIG